jgi:exodeoxyribonuclease VII large subunit
MEQPSLFNLQPERKIWRVSELTSRIAGMLEREFPDIWMEGEVSNFRPAQSGHLYFTLKDAGAQIRCVGFRDQARSWKFRPEDGLQVILRGAIGVYEPRGEYQVYVSYIEPAGLGALQLAFEQRKKKLAAEGLFDEERKKPLPVLPRRIGVISSPTGAAIRDILRVLKRRFPNVRLLLYPAKVQGEGAAAEIVEGVRYFNRAGAADVLIVARGGGSLEDLWAFNEETVARTIAASAIPVITGIGHETDFTIADLVADVRAPTPSAAAEIVVRSRQDFEKHLAESERRLIDRIRYRILDARQQVQQLAAHRGFRQLDLLVRRRRQQVDEFSSLLAVGLRLRLATIRQRLTQARAALGGIDLRRRAEVIRRLIAQQQAALLAVIERILTRQRRQHNLAQLRLTATDPGARIARLASAVAQRTASLRAAVDRSLVVKRRRLEAATLQLDERSPLRILERGYAIAYDDAGNVLRSSEQVRVGDRIAVRLSDATLDATVRRKTSS